MNRNRVDPERAERNRTEGEGRYTFYAPIPLGTTGSGIVVAALRLGDHAHLDVSSGEIVQRRPSDLHPEVNRGSAGHLILRWHEWELLREILAASDHVHIAEVERPSAGNLKVHVP